MIRVLQVIGSLNSGGSQAMIINIYKNINRENIQFDFIIDKENELFYSNDIEKLGGKIYVLPQYKIYNHFQYKKAWNKFFKEHPEYKIIHGHVRSTASIYLKLAKKYGLYTIAHSHSTSSGKGIKAIIKNILQYKIRYIADFFMGCSQEANEWLFGRRVANSTRCIVLTNAIDSDRFKINDIQRVKLRKKMNILEDEILFGHIGRFISAKNHAFLLKIFGEYNTNINKKSKLLFIGEGKTREKIMKAVKRMKLEEDVIFVDTVENIQDYYNAIDLLVFPSKYEGLGMVLIEAQFVKRKVIASDCIPKSTKISNYIRYISLNKKYKYWASECDKFLKSDINFKMDNKKLHLYDIKEQVKVIEKIYLEKDMYGGKNE